jgi:hypothetical protein
MEHVIGSAGLTGSFDAGLTRRHEECHELAMTDVA